MRYILVLVAGALCLEAQPPMHLTLAEAQRQAIQNNPQFSAAKYTAAAAYQVPLEYRSAYEPSLMGSFTSVGADNGSRLAAGGLNNPVVYNRLGSGLTVDQMITAAHPTWWVPPGSRRERRTRSPKPPGRRFC
jgi:hypothetical protein